MNTVAREQEHEMVKRSCEKGLSDAARVHFGGYPYGGEKSAMSSPIVSAD